jgi:hypothetical protein
MRLIFVASKIVMKHIVCVRQIFDAAIGGGSMAATLRSSSCSHKFRRPPQDLRRSGRQIEARRNFGHVGDVMAHSLFPSTYVPDPASADKSIPLGRYIGGLATSLIAPPRSTQLPRHGISETTSYMRIPTIVAGDSD